MGQTIEPKKPPLLTPILRWFMLAMVLANIAGSMSPLLMPIYLTKLGASVTQVGLVYTLTSIAILGLQVMGGWISDSIGRLRTIAIGSIGGIFGFIALLVAPTWQWMVIALMVYQFPFALVGPSFGAFIAENSAEENRGRVYGLTTTIYQVTGVIGPPLGGLLAGAYGFKWMLFVAAIFYSLAAGLRIWMATTMRSPEERGKASLSIQNFKKSIGTMASMIAAGGLLTWIFVADGIGDIAFRLSGEIQPLYLEKVAGISIEQIGFLGSINALAVMFIPLFSGKMSDKYGERVPIATGFVMIFAALLVFLQAKTFLIFAVSWVIFGIAIGLLDPAYQSLISKAVPSRLLGTFQGVFRGSLGLISLPAPWLGTQLWALFTPKTPFAVTALASLAILPIVWFKFRLPAKPEGKAVQAAS
jgi:DHA1 family multidrug resistance protein-like MFS transporter